MHPAQFIDHCMMHASYRLIFVYMLLWSDHIVRGLAQSKCTWLYVITASYTTKC